MATYQTGTVTTSSDWVGVIGNTLDSTGNSSTVFFVFNSDGTETQVTGTGFTYNGAHTAVTGGTITGLTRYSGGTSTGEQINGISVSATAFWADVGSQKLIDVLNGDDTFEIGTNQLATAGFTLNGYGGTNILNEAGATNDVYVIQFYSGGITIHDATTQSTSSVSLVNFSSFITKSGALTFGDQPVSPITANDVVGGLIIGMQYNILPGDLGILDLTADTLSGISQFEFEDNLIVNPGTAEVKFSSGLATFSSIAQFTTDDNESDVVDIVMTTNSFDASQLRFIGEITTQGSMIIDGSASSSGLTITGATISTIILGGSGNDSITGSNAQTEIRASTGHDTINGGTNGSTMDYSFLATPGIVVIYQGTSGTVNKGGSNGTDQLTNAFNQIVGSTASDVFYMDDSFEAVGDGGFDYLIELATNVHLTFGVDFVGISEIVLNAGINSLNLSGDSSIAYVYGSGGKDTLTLGSGGGYLFGEGGSNFLTGGNNAVNVFEGGSGGTNNMGGGGGTAVNYYYVTGSDTIEGAGAFNAMIELVAGVTVQIGSSQYQDVQEFVANSGTNVATVAAGDSDLVYLYGGAGNDTLSTGSGGGYLIGEGGTNTLTGGGGINVFIADNASGIDTMHGGTGSNLYYIDSHSIVQGAGTFNNVIELQQNASLVFGSAQLGSNVQQVIFNGGTNSADFHTDTSAVFLYGAAGNDTLFGGTGNDFLFGGLGTNTFKFATGWGHDTIEDWTAGTNSIMDLTGLASLGVHAITDLTQTITAGNDVITSSHTGTSSITLLGVGSALTAGSFHFA